MRDILVMQLLVVVPCLSTGVEIALALVDGRRLHAIDSSSCAG